MAKKVDLKAKQKRQKMIAAGLGVLFLALLAIQVPRTMKMMNQKPPEPAPAATPTPAPGTAVPLAPPTTGGAAAPTSGGAAAGGGGLTDSDPRPAPVQSNLVEFGRFASKDPFSPQIKDADETAGAAESTSTPKPKPAATSATPAPDPFPGSSAQPTPSTPSPQPAPASGPVTSATISINGAPETVSVGKEFPAASPVFHLVSLTRSSAKISIAGGSLASGAPTVTLTKGKPLTLMNTADGTRYELRLVSTQ